jgi:GntR family transcriptional repressor for pyruvate dehydrogenase complex
MARFRPIKQQRVWEEVAGQLKQSILVGHFKTGDRLPSERDLAEEFHVTRVAIREALRFLENGGFIVTRQGATGGAYITDLSFQQLVNAFLDLFVAERISIPELHEVRLLVEPEVAKRAAKRVTKEYAKRLQDALNQEKVPAASAHEETERKTSVHLILAEMCGNRFLEAIVRSVIGLSKTVVETVEPSPESLHPAGLHDAVVKAVLTGNGKGAAVAMEKHAVDFGKRLMKMEKAFRKKQSEV